MKKSLVLGSLAAALLMVGCSQKSGVDTSASQTQNMQNAQQGYVAGKDNFVNIEDRIQYVENGLQNIFFNFDQFSIRPDMQNAVDNDANVLALGSKLPIDKIYNIIRTFLETTPSNEERHIRRREMINNYHD